MPTARCPLEVAEGFAAADADRAAVAAALGRSLGRLLDAPMSVLAVVVGTRTPLGVEKGSRMTSSRGNLRPNLRQGGGRHENVGSPSRVCTAAGACSNRQNER